jgi:(p)ppGpp synthase/HD superfamily hydrolase
MTKSQTDGWPLSGRFDAALAYASRAHEGQFRKGTRVPYISHVLAVCGLVLEDGGSEDEAIAALLHDVVEDAGGAAALEQIRHRFGPAIAKLVDGCSDTDQTPKPPWKQRKLAHIARLRQAAPEVRRICSADKLHNARSILLDYRSQGEALWQRFNADGDETLWYYEELVTALREAGGGPLVEELARVVAEIGRLSGRR